MPPANSRQVAVAPGNTVQAGRKFYGPGEIVHLEAEEAERLIARGVCESVERAADRAKFRAMQAEVDAETERRARPGRSE